MERGFATAAAFAVATLACTLAALASPRGAAERTPGRGDAAPAAREHGGATGAGGAAGTVAAAAGAGQAAALGNMFRCGDFDEALLRHEAFFEEIAVARAAAMRECDETESAFKADAARVGVSADKVLETLRSLGASLQQRRQEWLDKARNAET
eukprot:CAMPEP_0206832796 /NCGR_PEP_ID=MMETSP0975-20121206/18068_1 /ASSEMBLY_ACC=CAM_ASM_000399 /TAXON_ID=483370 /ORGANISM="non described non described, Strain CCMP2097" /LENGTH=153 /DNA_ID=CAMNT_0054375181 /DNA_START=10 /DNA_END=472 /DNA_ORIENTATION=+